jgi:Flp pilus assembly pilin Flp
VTTRLVSDRPDPTAAFPPPTTPSLHGALRRLLAADDGAATAEYAIVIMAAVGFAGLLVVIMRSDEVRGTLSDLVRSALTVG